MFLDKVVGLVESLADRFREENIYNRQWDNREDDAVEDEIEASITAGLAASSLDNDVVDASAPLKAVGVDFKPKFNAANHHCEKFELVNLKKSTPVIRRGGSFTIIVQFNKGADLKKNQVKLYFSFGSNPNAHSGTMAILLVTGKKMFDKSYEKWDIRVEKQEGTKITLEVQVPVNAPVGVWRTAVEVTPNGDNTSSKNILRHDTLTYILFNPWNKHDDTYMSEEDYRQEYVLNDIGKIWVGSYPSGHGRSWVYGQFDDVVLPACILLMERSGLRPEARGDPIRVSRAITRMVNSNDRDNGVLIGSWSGKYDDGTNPSEWTGSISIMEEYIMTKKSVRYGQCWVFAGVVNTVCRALGLPSRVVSNFNSAHDTNFSLTIDEYFDKKGEEIDGYRFTGNTPGGIGDSIWNFHVWNDVWMARPDLPPGYGGWQAIDATPQEQSDGIFQCGPASHEAIRRGETEYKYDVPFVLAEVNADVVRWREDETELDGFKILGSNIRHVGKQILTKKLGKHEESRIHDTDKEDCTGDYKQPEGSQAERMILLAAAKRSRVSRHAFRIPSKAIDDVDFSIEDVERVPIGDDFAITVKAVNTSDQKRTVFIYLTAASRYYIGTKAQLIARAEGQFTLAPKETKSLSLPVTADQYYHKLVEYGMVKLVALCNVKETSYSWADEDHFEFLKPRIKVEVLSKAIWNKPLRLRFSFTNPLNLSLTDCLLTVDGPGLVRPNKIPIDKVGPKAEMVKEVDVRPTKEGDTTMVATFNSKELINLSGSSSVIHVALS